MNTCDYCKKRTGKLVHQDIRGPKNGKFFILRRYICQWCLGVENRTSKKANMPTWKYVEFKTDEESLKR